MLIQKPLKTRSRLSDALSELMRGIKYRIDPLTGFAQMKRRAAKTLNYLPDLQNPQTYNDKINWRKAFDRNPAFPVVSDKLAVRDFVAQRLGRASAEKIMTKVLFATDDIREIDRSKLPDRFVMKANHASGWNAFVSPEHPATTQDLRDCASRWLRRSYGKEKHEWAYQPIKRKIVFEEMMCGPDGDMPRDIKFAVFNGTCKFIVFIDGRFDDHCWYHMSPKWERLICTPPSASANPVPDKPSRYDEMLKIAEQVSEGFDFFRVDFMFLGDSFVLNEITLYDASGRDPLDPPVWDKRFGEFWTLPK